MSDAGARYRISVKREDRGVVSSWLHRNARAGSVIEVAAPRGDFYLSDDAVPVVLLSAGIGATPVLAMLHALAAAAVTAKSGGFTSPATRRPSPSAGKSAD